MGKKKFNPIEALRNFLVKEKNTELFDIAPPANPKTTKEFMPTNDDPIDLADFLIIDNPSPLPQKEDDPKWSSFTFDSQTGETVRIGQLNEVVAKLEKQAKTRKRRNNDRNGIIKKSIATGTTAAIITIAAGTAWIARQPINEYLTHKLSGLGDFYAASIASVESGGEKRIYVSPLEKFQIPQEILDRQARQAEPEVQHIPPEIEVAKNTTPYFGLTSRNHDTNYIVTIGGVANPTLTFKIANQSFNIEPGHNIDLYKVLNVAMKNPKEEIQIMLKDETGKIQASVKGETITLLDITKQTLDNVDNYTARLEEAKKWEIKVQENKKQLQREEAQFKQRLEALIQESIPTNINVVKPQTIPETFFTKESSQKNPTKNFLEDVRIPIQITIDDIALTTHYDKLDINLGYLAAAHMRRDWKLSQEERTIFEKIVNKYVERGAQEPKNLAQEYSDKFLVENILDMYTQMNTKERQKIAPMLECNILEFTLDLEKCGPQRHENIDAALMDYYAFPQRIVKDIAIEHEMAESTIYRNRKQLHLPERRLLEKIARAYQKITKTKIANYFSLMQDPIAA